MLDLQGYGAVILSGTWVNVTAGLLSLIVAVALGIVGALAKLSRNPVARGVAMAYTTLVRGVPDLVLMLLIFFGGQLLVNQVAPALGHEDYVDVDPFTAGVLTLGFIYGAYMSETFRGAILAVPAGQLEAGRAFGMRPVQVFARVLLPQMLRHALPGFGNNWLVLLKGTALLSIIGLNDMVFKASQAGGSTHKPFTFLFAVALIYLAMTTVSVLGLRWAERHADRPYSRAPA